MKIEILEFKTSETEAGCIVCCSNGYPDLRSEENLRRIETLEKEGKLPLAQRRLIAWLAAAHDGQYPPDGDWRVWLFMGGRGAGKTWAGAQWVRAEVREGRARRVALVGPTLGDVREVMIEGPSGIRAVSDDDERPVYQVSRRRLAWPNGAEGFAFSAEDPDSLRGPQFDAAWCDEIGAWARGEKAWDMLMFGLRLGERPRAVATTTPRPTALVRRLLKLDGVEVSRAGMAANAKNLAPGFEERMRADYAGTRLERQEIDGELVEDPPGALWTRGMIEGVRIAALPLPAFQRVVVAVDPPAAASRYSDACGIVVAGLHDKTAYVLADGSVRGARPLEWAGRAAALARMWGAGEIVAEANQGGEMVREVLRAAGADARVRLMHALKSKHDRALPVSTLYEQGRVKHAGVFRELEDEMCAFGAEGGRSPDRVDALVWAVVMLMERRALPKVSLL